MNAAMHKDLTQHWTEDYRVVVRNDEMFEFIHIPSDTIILVTRSVSMETLNGLMNEFDTYGKIRPNWREGQASSRIRATNKARLR